MHRKLLIMLTFLLTAALCACNNTAVDVNSAEFQVESEQTVFAETTQEPEVTPKATPQVVACPLPEKFTDFEELKQYIREEKANFFKDIQYIPVLDCSDGKLQFAFATCTRSYVNVYYTSPGIDIDRRVCISVALYDTIDDGGYMSYMHKRYGTFKMENAKRTVYYGGIDYELPGGGWGKEETLYWQENGLDTEIHTPYYVYSELGYTTEDIVNMISFSKL